MGTRSITIVRSGPENKSPRIVTIYRQMDGYPSGMGADLADFLKGIKMVNGIGMDNKNVANGAGCLAAQLVKHLKDGAGGIYLEAGSGDYEDGHHGEDYIYEIYADTMKPAEGIRFTCRVSGEKKLLFDGKPELFDPAAVEAE